MTRQASGKYIYANCQDRTIWSYSAVSGGYNLPPLVILIVVILCRCTALAGRGLRRGWAPGAGVYGGGQGARAVCGPVCRVGRSQPGVGRLPHTRLYRRRGGGALDIGLRLSGARTPDARAILSG